METLALPQRPAATMSPLPLTFMPRRSASRPAKRISPEPAMEASTPAVFMASTLTVPEPATDTARRAGISMVRLGLLEALML